ncbi:MAG: hypothetical protein AB2792_03815 [Candidatus Thiodiazotropha sp.]
MKRTFGHEDASAATRESLDTIIKNNDIHLFLDTLEKRYLVGPKGSGKTLLLLRKAIDRRESGDGLCIPSTPSTPVDRLDAAEHVGKKFNYQISDPSEAGLAWATVWKHAIYSSVLHHLRDELLNDIEADNETDSSHEWLDLIQDTRDQDFRTLLDQVISSFSPIPLGPFHYFTELGHRLDVSGHKMLSQVRNECQKMNVYLSMVRRPIYVFLDNLDDYYEREPALWVNSMYGQLRAVREVSLSHKNIHLFTSIRQDVFEQFNDEMRLQYYDYVAHLKYTKKELLQIFATHITELDDDLLVDSTKRKADPWHAFFGDAELIHDKNTDTHEHACDYIYRHTLGRPRDIIHIGTILLKYRTDSGFTADDVRNAVRTAQTDISLQYLKEVEPLTGDFIISEFLSKHVHSYFLNADDIENAMLSFFVELEKQGISLPDYVCCLNTPFETLYDLGLLGYIQEVPGTDRCIQQFRRPGQGLSQSNKRTLPESRCYFIHPVIHHLLPQTANKAPFILGHEINVECN